jgi:membrane protease YdiL (CAAX protease family)
VKTHGRSADEDIVESFSIEGAEYSEHLVAVHRPESIASADHGLVNLEGRIVAWNASSPSRSGRSVNATPQDEPLAAKLRGFGPLGVAAALVVVALGPVLEPFNIIPALAWVHYSRTPWSDVGLARPKSWPATIAFGTALGVALKLTFKAIVMPLLGAPALNAEYHYLYGNLPAALSLLVVAIVGAGFGEELVFRGFLFERLGRLFGRSAAARVGIVLATSVVFGAIHYPMHGIYSATQALLDGLVFGAVFAITGRLWTVIFAHAAFDVVAILIIYAGWEERIAQLIAG